MAGNTGSWVGSGREHRGGIPGVAAGTPPRERPPLSPAMASIAGLVVSSRASATRDGHVSKGPQRLSPSPAVSVRPPRHLRPPPHPPLTTSGPGPRPAAGRRTRCPHARCRAPACPLRAPLTRVADRSAWGLRDSGVWVFQGRRGPEVRACLSIGLPAGRLGRAGIQGRARLPLGVQAADRSAASL